MSTAVYLAYPIDMAAGVLDDYQAVRNHMIREPGLSFYDPGRAWNCADCQPDARIQAVNNAALIRADALVAILPQDVSTVGTPMEIAWAASAGIPCHVLRDAHSWALMIEGVTQHYELWSLLDAISHLQPIPRRERPQALFVPDQDIDDLDPAPRQGYEGDAGFDLIYYGKDPIVIGPGRSHNIPAGVRIEWPPNTWALVLGRSSTFHKRGLLVHPAVIDPGYRGEMFANVRNITLEEHTVLPGERIAQVIPLPALAGKMGMRRVEQLSDSHRGEKGFGSSGT